MVGGPIDPERAFRRYLALIAGSASLGGLLFGYDTAVISGAIGFIQEHFHLAAGMTGWAASSLLVGCMAGAIIGGPLSDRLGRKPMLFSCAIIFALSGLGSAVATDLTLYSWSRLFGGLGVGIASVLSPLYIAEVAPERVRGRLVSFYQLAIVTGILVSFFVNLVIQRHGAAQLPLATGESWNAAHGWRWMLGALALPAAAFGLMVIPLPESPRWLLKRGRRAEAAVTLVRLRGAVAAETEMEQIEASLHEEEGKFSELFHGGYGRAMFVGLVLAVFSQFGGINAIMYYGPEIFKAAGSGVDQAFLSTVILGVTILVATFGAIAFVDNLGRKTLLIAGVSIQIVALFAVGFLYLTKGAPGMILVFIILYLVGFASSTGAVTWVVISEIFPTKVRGQAMGVAVLALWGADYIVAQTFPMLTGSIGVSWTFFCYAFCCVIGLVFTIVMVPETKGRTLEEIGQSWGKKERGSSAP